MDVDMDTPSAPVLAIPRRQVAVLEHPALLKSLGRGIDTLGANVDYQSIVNPDGPQTAVPLFLRHEDPASSVLLSHNAASHNVVLAVTLPKRTGRKRKRGTDGPWEAGSSVSEPEESTAPDGEAVAGDSLRQRDPQTLRRKMQDNAGRYKVSVVGLVKHTHRYRGLFDFQQSVHDSKFMAKFTDKILPGELSKIREFELTPGVSAPPHVDIPPPPFFTTQTLPFSYFYSQNPFVREVSTHDGAVQLVNSTAATTLSGYFLKFDEEPVPTEPPPSVPVLKGRRKMAIVAALRQAVEERPVWTRRGLVNHMSQVMGLYFTENRLKQYFAHVCFQFKGGPWRDTLVAYGYDPRKDAAAGKYQTLFFKLHQHADRKRASWLSVGPRQPGGGPGGEPGGEPANEAAADEADEDDPDEEDPQPAMGVALSTPLVPNKGRQDTHIFDGQSYCDDGKIWQVCDITDPMIADMLARAPRRPTCDVFSTGWFHQGTWAKTKATMKAKLLAIRFGRIVPDAQYRATLALADESPRLGVRSIKVPIPNLHLTPEEEAVIAVKTYYGRPKKRVRKRGTTSVSVPVEQQRKSTRGAGAAASATTASVPSSRLGEEGEEGREEEEREEEEREEEEEEEEEEDERDEEEEDEEEDEAEDDEEEEAEEEEEEEEDDDNNEGDGMAIKEEILEDMDDGDVVD